MRISDWSSDVCSSDLTVAVDDVSLLDNQALVLTTPYAEADLQGITAVQSADVMYLFHEDYPTYKLLRFGHTSWSLQRVAWQDRSEERRVGQERVRTCISRW